MNLFDVYPLLDVEPVKAKGCYIWDKKNQKYLDLYGGHAVISIGHSHPDYIKKISEQLNKIGFYSNSVQNPLQQELVNKLGKLSGYNDYQVFLTNSGAEANENALKLASFHNGRKKIIAFNNSFHGRTSATVAVTDNPDIRAKINFSDHVTFLPLNDESVLETNINEETCAVIIEGVQGVGGIHIPDKNFLEKIAQLCSKHNVIFILDEVQSGYGRSGKFFAHQYANIKPDIISIAKGMGNGFPIGGILIHSKIKPKHGMLGTTFGGNHLACAAAIAVLEIIENEALTNNALTIGNYLLQELNKIEKIQEVRGKGLMIAIDLFSEAKSVREKLLYEHFIFTGSASDKKTIRLLPPLSLTLEQADYFLEKIKIVLK